VKTVPDLARPVASGAGTADLDQPAWLIRLGATGKGRWCVPGRVGKLRNGDPAYPTVTGESGELHMDCHTAFGFKENTAQDITEDLLARWAVAARLVPEVLQVQLELSVHRFKRLEAFAAQSASALPNVKLTQSTSFWSYLFEDSNRPDIGFADLLASSSLATAVIDCFINTPVHALPAVRRAYDRAVAGWQAEFPNDDVDTSTSAFRARLLLAYLSERRYYAHGPTTRGAQDAAVWRGRNGTNNVSADRVAKLLDRIEETLPDPDLGSRKLVWTADFRW